MSIIVKSIEAWFKQQPIWLQDAARRLIGSGDIKDSDIRELTLICKKEAGFIIEGETVPKLHGIPEGSLQYKHSG